MLCWKTKSVETKPGFVAFADFCGVNMSTITDFMLSIVSQPPCRIAEYLTISSREPVPAGINTATAQIPSSETHQALTWHALLHSVRSACKTTTVQLWL